MSKILIVDDLSTEIQVMKTTVGGLGHHVVEARDGEEGIRLAKQEKPDLILLDVVLPKVDGFQVCRRLKKDPETANIPIILVSTKNQESDQFWGIKQGATAYLSKPIDTSALSDNVKKLLAA